MSEGQRELEIEGKGEREESERARERARAREILRQTYAVCEQVLLSVQQDTLTSAISTRRLASVCQQLCLQQHAVVVGGG